MPEDFETLFRVYEQDVFRFLLRLCGGDESWAEELTQEAFFEAYLALPGFAGRCQVKSWLIQIAKTRFYLTVRRRRYQERFLAMERAEAAPAAGPEEALLRRELLSRARRIIDGMQPRMRDVMLYRLCSELPYAEIAALLSISESSAKVLFHRGKLLLRARLKEDDGDEN